MIKKVLLIFVILFCAFGPGILYILTHLEEQHIYHKEISKLHVFPKRLYHKSCLENKEIIVIRDNVMFNLDSNGKPIYCESKK